VAQSALNFFKELISQASVGGYLIPIDKALYNQDSPDNHENPEKSEE
jgi:hypothetical protein